MTLASPQRSRKPSPSDCPSKSPCPTTATATSPLLPKGFWSPSPLVSPEGREVVQPRAGHPRDVVVSATRLDDRPDLDTIEHLDFDPVVPCEARIRGGLHGGRADVLIVGQCPGCAATKRNLRRYGMCWRHWRKAKSVELFCEACGHKDVMAGGFFRIVEVLR